MDQSGFTRENVAILLRQGFSRGLAKALAENVHSFERRIWVVDNSGSMLIPDGHLVHTNQQGQVALTPSTRWEELQDTVIYHSQMAALMKSHTHFRLLNHPGEIVGLQEFTVGVTEDVETDVRNARAVMQQTKPQGVTPLTEHIHAIRMEIERMLSHLSHSGKRVAVVLATDGLPSDVEGYGGKEITDEFVQALRGLEGLPIWVVIRLCTDEDQVTRFYNELDEIVDLQLEVLDDFLGECREVQKKNPWLNYALPMHRCRELGYHNRLFDLIDERPLNTGELQNFCELLFGTELKAIPDPIMDWNEFVQYVRTQLNQEQLQWNPIHRKKLPWINIRKLNAIHGGLCCSTM
eukprot:Nitzschia sp. Nitz4//scaffold14_size191712//130833//131996//NITZ4_001739-RA/size191712-snap-gene-0.138-mRNA-1//1//CDS//3329536975//5927//frame0